MGHGYQRDSLSSSTVVIGTGRVSGRACSNEAVRAGDEGDHALSPRAEPRMLSQRT